MEPPLRKIPTAVASGVLFAALGVLSPAQPAEAHPHPCAHTHENPPPMSDTVIHCDNADAPCTGKNGKSGTCKEKGITRSWCECVVPSGGGCTSKINASFDGVPGGLPTENTSVTYTAVVDPGNFWDLIETGTDVVIRSFGPSESFLQGTVTLHYGSFADPTAVPVEIVSMSLTSPSVPIRGFVTGTNSIYLPGGTVQTLDYDSTTGFLESPDAAGITLKIDNDVIAGQTATLYLEAQVQPGGALLFGQGVAFFPLPSVPSLAPGRLLLLGALLAGTAILARRTWLWAHSSAPAAR